MAQDDLAPYSVRAKEAGAWRGPGGTVLGTAQALFESVAGIPEGKPGRLPSGRLPLPTGHQIPLVPVEAYPDEEPHDAGFEPWDPPDGGDVRRRMTEEGIEFLAVYAPYTYWGADWGVYFFANRIYDFASSLVAEDPRLGHSSRHLLDGLMTMIQAHEMTHFRVELAAMHYRSATGFDHYSRYHDQFAFAAPGSDAMEEAIATAIELREGREGYPDVARALARRTATMPRGYRDHRRYSTDAGFDLGTRKLAARLVGRDGLRRRVPADLLSEPVGALYERSVPRYWLIEGSLHPWFRDYLLGRAYRQLTLRDVLRHAERQPGAAVKPAGKHQRKVYFRGNSVALPDHPHVNRSFPDHIIRQLAGLFGMTRSEYLDSVLGA